MHINERQKLAAKGLVEGKPIYRAMIDAGYSRNTAVNGRQGVSAKIIRAMGKHGRKFIDLGRISAEDQELMVRGRLVANTIEGKDSGVMSAKALGTDRRVNMFTPENMVGIQIINAPKEMSAAIVKEEE